MRVIAGTLGGRSFASPAGHKTHPMSEKIRGALFNTLGDIAGLTVLDAFGGSGALSFEALSRSAKSAVAVESDKTAYDCIVKNVQDLSISTERLKAIRANVSSWSDNNPQEQLDIVMCDPPYDNVRPELLEKLARHAKSGGLAIYSLPPTTDFSLPDTGYTLLARKNYGDATLHFYRKN